MKLDRIDIQRLPGISEPFSLAGLSPGVNIIVGPNGSGKSSLCRAVRGTLWPAQLPADWVELESHWTGSDGPLHAVVRGGVQWRERASGEPTNPPVLPSDHLAHCYTLGLKDLLDAGSAGDRALADQLRVQMAGGFDLAAAAHTLYVKQSHGKREASEVAAAQQALQRLEGERRALGLDVDRLDALRDELELAEAASGQLLRLQRVRECRERQSELSAVLDRLEAQPAGSEFASGREVAEWDELARDILSMEAGIADADERLVSAETECAACGITGEPLDEAELRNWSERAQILSDTERSLVEAMRQASETTASRRAAVEDLAGAAHGDDLALLDPADLDAVDAWIADALESDAQKGAIEARLLAIPEEDVDDLEVFQQAAGHLREWQSATAKPLLLGRRRLFAACAVLLLAGGLAAFVHPGWSLAARLAAFVNPTWPLPDGLARLVDPTWPAPGGLAVLVYPACALVAGLVSGALLVAWRSARTGGHARARIEARFAELDVTPPSEWKAQSVGECLTQADGEVRKRVRAQQLAAEREGLVAQRGALVMQEAKLRERRQELDERIGVDPGARPLRLADWTLRLRSWRETVAAEQAALQRCELLRDEATTRAARLRDFLAGIGENAEAVAAQESPARGPAAAQVEAAPQLRGMLESLRDRGGRWRRARESATTAERERTARSRQLRELQERREALLRRVSVDPGGALEPRTQLVSLVEARPAYREDCDRRVQLELRIKEIRQELADHQPLFDLDEAGLTAAIEEADSRSESRTQLAQEIGGIVARVRDASEGDARERAAAALTAAESSLEESLEELRIAAAGRFLLADVEAEHEAKSRPDVLRRATEAFASFTHHHFALEMTTGDAGAKFRARETATGGLRELDELSDGTRMQLLLAVRLAFATAAEAGPPLPLFLDEALTASDPQRFRAVAGSLLAFAAGGRQIFYLTCDPADVALWQQVAKDEGAPAPLVVDLSATRRLGAAFEPRSVPSPTSVAPPPDNGSANDYAALLGVPAPDPWRGGEALHLFHPLRGDLSLLHRLLDKARVATVGHWRLLRETQQWKPVLGAKECARVDALTEIVVGVVEAWQVGRGRPVDRSALAAARILTDTQLQRVLSLSDDLGGDARRLLGLLEGVGDARVKNIRQDKKAALRIFFEECGNLVPESPLDATGIRIRALANVEQALAAGQLDRHEAAARADELVAQLPLG